MQTAAAQNTTKISRTIAYYAGFVALGMTTASLGPTLPGLAAHTRSTLGEVSFLFTARSLGYLLGSLGGGRWFDRFPGHRIQAGMLLLMAGMIALAPTVPMLWLLAAVLVVLGFGEGTLDVGGNTLLVWVHGKEVGPFMNGLHLFFGLGSFLSPVIIAQAVLLSGDITWAYWILALLILPVVIWVARLPSPPIMTGHEDGRDVRLNYGLIGLVMLFFFLNVGSETSFGGWIFTYARALNLGTETGAAYLTSMFWGSFTLGRLLSIPIATRFHPRWILLGVVLAGLASLALILAGRSSYPIVLTGVIGTGLSMASIFPTTITLAGRYLPINGRITGLFFVGGSAGAMFFPWLIGQLFEPVGPQVTMVLILAALTAALAVYGALMLRFNQ
ncbi:MAG TPA: MFS transporter [Anaerolineales bacterium]